MPGGRANAPRFFLGDRLKAPGIGAPSLTIIGQHRWNVRAFAAFDLHGTNAGHCGTTMRTPSSLADEIREQCDAIKRELADVAPYAFADQRNLDANTPERAYWHLGYCAALTDVLRRLSGDVSQRSDSKDTSN